jgi:undecaprenyl-diphosphatase
LDAWTVNAFDENLSIWVNDLSGSSATLDSLMRLLTSDYTIPPLLAITLIATIFAGRTAQERLRWQRAAFVGIIAVGMTNWAIAVSNGFWDRLRPYEALPDDITLLFYPATDPSFPANPTGVGAAVAVALWGVGVQLRYFLIALTLLVAIGRLYVGVHYPTDLVGGAVIGVAMAFTARGIMRVFDPVMNLALRAARAFALA